MKKIVVALAILLSAHFVIAQNNASINKRAEYLTDWLSDMLNLKTPQKNKVFIVYQSYLNNMISLLDTYRHNITELRNQKDVLEVVQQQSIGAILNDEQFAKYQGIISKRVE